MSKTRVSYGFSAMIPLVVFFSFVFPAFYDTQSRYCVGIVAWGGGNKTSRLFVFCVFMSVLVMSFIGIPNFCLSHSIRCLRMCINVCMLGSSGSPGSPDLVLLRWSISSVPYLVRHLFRRGHVKIGQQGQRSVRNTLPKCFVICCGYYHSFHL